MLTFIIMILLILVIGILTFYKGTSDKRKKIFLILSTIVLFFFMGFRDLSIGTDTKLYYTIFNIQSSKTFFEILTSGDSSILYVLYNKVLSLFFHFDNTIVLFNSLIILVLSARFIYKNSEHVVISQLLFIGLFHYFSAFNIARQYIAILIIANGFTMLKENKIGKYCIYCIIATLVHNTAIIGFCLIPLALVKLNKKTIMLYTVILSTIVVFLNPVMELFAKLFPHYQMYLSGEYMESGGSGNYVLVIIHLFISVLAFLTNQKKDTEKDYNMLFIINNIAIILILLSARIVVLSRISLYFTIFAVVFIPKVFEKIKGKNLLYLLFILLILVPTFVRLKKGDSEVVPYKNIIIEAKKENS